MRLSKENKILAISLMIYSASVSSCSNNNEVPVPETQISYSMDMQPYFDAKCIGCHGSRDPNLETPDSYDNIIKKRAFTINIPSEKYAKEADYFGIATGSKTDKFADTGLTPVKSDLVDAPYIKEFPLILECKMTHKTEIGIHILFVGEIVDVKAEESVLGENGLPDINKVQPVLFAPEARTYHGIGKTIGKAFSIGKEIK